MADKVELDIRETIRRSITMDVEVRITHFRSVKIRLWIAVQLCRLAAWIGGYGLKINQEVGVLVTDISSERDIDTYGK